MGLVKSAIQVPRVRRALLESPATCQEIADILGMTVRNAHVALWVLTKTKHAKVVGKVPNEGAKARNLYELTPHGRYMAKRR